MEIVTIEATLFLVFAIFAELIVLNLPLFVGVLIIFTEMTLLCSILLELSSSRDKSLNRIGSLGFLVLLAVIVTWRSAREVPLVLGELFLYLLKIKVLTIRLIDDFLNSVLVDLAKIIKISHASICVVDSLAIWKISRVLLAANWERGIVACFWLT